MGEACASHSYHPDANPTRSTVFAMPIRLPKPLEPITENLRNRSRTVLHEKLGVRPFVFKVRQAGQAQLVRIRTLGDSVEAARIRVRQILPKAVEIHEAED